MSSLRALCVALAIFALPTFATAQLLANPDEIVDKVVEHWIAGFLTAHDLYVADTYNVAGNTTMDEMKARLENICRANGKQRFAEAMVTLVQQLNSQRVKADAGK